MSILNNINEFKEYVNEQILIEILNKLEETEFTEAQRTIGNFTATEYRFKTNSENEYLLHFLNILLDSNTKIENDMLSDLVKPNSFIYGRIPARVIMFTSANWNGNANNYSDSTNHNEPLELLSRIGYLTSIYKNRNPKINIWIVGNENGDDRRLKTYELLFRNLFSSVFEMFKGKFMNYKNYTMFYINKAILNEK